MNDEVRRNLALFPIGIVQKLTELTARQIRYYEQHKLVAPVRTEGNQRLFSFNDVERLLEIKKLIDQGLNIAGIKRVIGPMKQPTVVEMLPDSEETKEFKKDLSDKELHDLLKQELINRAGRIGGPPTLLQGELARFFH